MLTPRASASTSSGWAYSRSIRSRTRRNSARSRRCCDEADLLVTTRSCHVSRQAREPHTVAHTRGSDAGGNASPGAACLAGGGGLDEDVDREDHVTLSIRLLGPPALERDGRSVAAPRGGKAWAVLAYLLLAERPPGRRQLAELLFGDADDPLGALRWTLAELRRALGQPGLFGGDPVATAVGPAAGAPPGPPRGGRAAVLSQLDAGQAAITAGAVQAGLDSLRRAVADAAA